MWQCVEWLQYLLAFILVFFFVTESCKVEFHDPNVLHKFTLTIAPGKTVTALPIWSTNYVNFYKASSL